MDVSEYDNDVLGGGGDEDDSTKKGPRRDKKKYVPRSIEEDPHQYHAKPSDVSKGAAPMPSSSSAKSDASTVFAANSLPFSAFGLEPRLADHIGGSTASKNGDVDGTRKGMCLKMATKVQSIVIPSLIASSGDSSSLRKNLLIKSQTGSGKTLAYLVPIVNDLMRLQETRDRSNGTFALILSPTRELCSQITEVLAKLTFCCVWIVGGSLSGGENKKSEKVRILARLFICSLATLYLSSLARSITLLRLLQLLYLQLL
jgi:hypothetical protein